MSVRSRIVRSMSIVLMVIVVVGWVVSVEVLLNYWVVDVWNVGFISYYIFFVSLVSSMIVLMVVIVMVGVVCGECVLWWRM